MIYLFNSAFRPRYVRNVLNTLYLPGHCVNEYRYVFTGDKPNISAGFHSSLGKLQPGVECVVIFVDRYAPGGYAYHPLRKARFIGHRIAADYIYIKVELLDFIYPQDPQRFNNQLIAELRDKGMPCLTEGNPEYRHDGHYAIESDSIFSRVEDFKTKDDAWSSAVTALSSTRALRTDESQWPIFIKADLQRRKDKLSLVPVLQNQATLFRLTKDQVFELVLTYRFPQQRADNSAQSRVEIKFGESIKPLGGSSLAVDSASNSSIVPFTTRRYAEDNRGNIELAPLLEPKPQVLLPEAYIEYLLEEGGSFWFQVVAALALYAIAGAMIGVDFSKLRPFCWWTLGQAALPRIGLASIQALGLFWLFRRIGKKVL